MGMTFAQKALARAAGKDYVDIGEIVMANVDVAMMDDILGPRIEIAAGLKELGVDVWVLLRVRRTVSSGSGRALL